MEVIVNKYSQINVRLNENELNKLNELSIKSNLKKGDFIRNLIMTADSNIKDQLSIEILQRIYTVLQVLVGTMKDLLPGKITQEWMNEIIAEAKKRYPID